MKVQFGVIAVVLFLSAAIGALCWPYALNEWLLFLGKPPSVVWWHGALLGLTPFIGQLSSPAAVVTWVLMLVMG